jgi:hypothetical protein
MSRLLMMGLLVAGFGPDGDLSLYRVVLFSGAAGPEEMNRQADAFASDSKCWRDL